MTHRGAQDQNWQGCCLLRADIGGGKFQNLQVNFYYILSYFWPIIWLYIANLWTFNDILGKIYYKFVKISLKCLYLALFGPKMT